MQYTRLTQGVTDKGKLIPSDKLYENVTDHNKDWYASLYYYTAEHVEQFKKTKTVAGIVGLTTDKLIFDFDSKLDVNAARLEALELVNRLQATYGFQPNNIQIYYSGMKGMTVVVDIDKQITSSQLKNICLTIGKGLKTLDQSIYNDSRIIRVAGTKHPVSGLYKIPLSYQLLNSDIEVIKEIAKVEYGTGEDFSWSTQIVGEEILSLSKKKEELVAKTSTITDDIDWVNKPKEWKNCKYSLLQGFFPEGKRNDALMTIVATSHALGYDKETAYYLAKSALKKREARYNIEFSKEELWETVITTVYSGYWKGGQYTCKQEGWLKDYCESLGVHKCSNDKSEDSLGADQISSLFQDYADHYEENVLTTGIEVLDKNPHCRFLMGTFNGLVAGPSTGKTSIALSILSHLSNKEIDTLFFSYDMFHSMVYLRIVQKLTGLQQDEIFKIFTEDKKESARIKQLVNKEFSHVNFCFTQGQSVADIQETLESTENKLGRKIKMVIIDYNELILSQFSDPVQAGAEVAQKLRQIANDKQVCILTLLQPSKLYANPADEIDSFRAVKGSTSIAQSVTMMLAVSRPGFNPRQPEDDRFMSIAAVKNRNGPLFSVDLAWEGLTGTVRTMTYEETMELEQIRRERDERNEESEGRWS